MEEIIVMLNLNGDVLVIVYVQIKNFFFKNFKVCGKGRDMRNVKFDGYSRW